MRDERRRAIRLVGGMSLACAVMILGNASPAQAGYSLDVTIQGFGTVTKSPDKSSYNSGEVVALTAVPAAGYMFGAWNGQVAELTNATTTIKMNNHRTVTAIFGTPLVHVATNGLDTNPGTVAQPVATMTKALSLIDGQPQSGEIVIHGGIYYLTAPFEVTPLSGNVPYVSNRSLLIRAAESEEIIFDGSCRIDIDAQELTTSRGIYIKRGDFPSQRPPALWEGDFEKLYRRVVNQAAMQGEEAVSVIRDPQTLVFRRAGGKALDGTPISMGLAKYGLWIKRSHVRVSGIKFRYFLNATDSCGIFIGQGGAVIQGVEVQDCELTRSSRGLSVFNTEGTKIHRCHITDVGQGIHNQGSHTEITFCRILNDGNHPVEPVSFREGMRTYFHGKGVTFSHNLVKGFDVGILIKTETEDPFIIEHNTLIFGLPKVPVGGSGNAMAIIYWNPASRVQYNLMVDYPYPFPTSSDVVYPPGPRFNRNLFADPKPYGGNLAYYTKFLQDKGYGAENLIADPQFADPGSNDFRLLPASPGWQLLDPYSEPPGYPAGAFFDPVPSSYTGKPRLRVELPQKFDSRNNPIQRNDYYSVSETLGESNYISVTPNVALDLYPASVAAIKDTKIKIDDQPAYTKEFAPNETIALPSQQGMHTLEVSVIDVHGSESEVKKINCFLVLEGMKFVREPTVEVFPTSAVVKFQPDHPGWVELSLWENETWVKKFTTAGQSSSELPSEFSHFNTLMRIYVTDLQPQTKYQYKLQVGDTVRKSVTVTGDFTTSGSVQAKTLFVSPAGEDREENILLGLPVRSVQYALDRVRPGDRVLLEPGVYQGSFVLRQGGDREHPVMIEGREPNTVYFDALKEYNYCLTIDRAPHVQISNINFTWFGSSGINANQSASVTVRGCRFQNLYWISEQWERGTCLHMRDCPSAKIEYNIFSNATIGVYLYRSPQAAILHNTAVCTSVTAIYLDTGSCVGSAVRYNSGNFSMNHPFQTIAVPEDFSKLDIDYNNWGTRLQKNSPEQPVPNPNMAIPLEHSYLEANRELIYIKDPVSLVSQTFYTLPDWQAYSGKEPNSIFTDPLFVSPINGRFDVRAGSPNLRDDLPDGSGFIGAVGHHPELPQPPSVTLTSPAGGRRFSTTASILFDAEASADRGGSIAGVSFYINGSPYSEDSSAPYSYRRTLPAGEYKIRALATDNSGLKTATPEIVITVQAGIVYGDVSGDGQIMAEDAWLVARYSVGLIPDAQIPGLCNGLTAEEFRRRGDVDGNPGLSANDAMLIAKRAVGLIDRFPVEKE